MDDLEILAAFRERRGHYEAWLQGNGVEVCTCPGCGFPALPERGAFVICIVCDWEDDGQDDHAASIFAGLELPGPNGTLTLHANRINIGRMLETNAEMIDGETDTNVPRVLQTIAFFRQCRDEIATRITGDEHPLDHIRIEWKEVKRDLLMGLVVRKD